MVNYQEQRFFVIIEAYLKLMVLLSTAMAIISLGESGGHLSDGEFLQCCGFASVSLQGFSDWSIGRLV